MEARGVDFPHHAQDKTEEGAVPKVMFDIFFSGGRSDGSEFQALAPLDCVSWRVRDEYHKVRSKKEIQRLTVRHTI